MIVFNNNKTEAQNINPELLNGVFYGIICGVYIKEQSETNTIFSCSVYIPEIYGPYEYFYNYPKVEIYEKQDSDDIGSVPQVGDLVKVSFDDGNSNSCRLIMAIPMEQLGEEIRIKNANYIENGVLPTTILDIDDPKVLQVVLNWLDDAYYVTTGKHKKDINMSLFTEQYYLTSKNDFNSYFLGPLSLPFISEWHPEEEQLTFTPVFLSNIYLSADILAKLYKTKRKDLVKIYDDLLDWSTKRDPMYVPISESEMKDIENKDDLKVAYMTCLLSGISPYYYQIIFSDSLENDIGNLLQSSASNNYNNGYAIYEWWQYYNTRKYTHYPAKFMYDNLSDIETEWAKSCVSWETGLNTLMSNNSDTNLKKVILFCFTIFPWIVYPWLGYEADSASFSSSGLLISEIMYKFYGIDKRTYNALFKDDKEYKEISKQLSDLIKKESLTKKEFILTFQKLTKSLCTGWTWDKCNMDAKFKRLLQIIDSWNEIQTTDYNAVTSNGTSFQVPTNQRDFKSYMDLTALGKDTARRKFIENKGHIDENGIWKIGQYYCVAMGQYYTGKGSNFDLGRTFQITLDTRVVLNVVITEAKALNDTTDNYKVDKNNGSIIEFIVNTSRLNSTARRMGSLSSLPAFKGTITSIIKTGKIS